MVSGIDSESAGEPARPANSIRKKRLKPQPPATEPDDEQRVRLSRQISLFRTIGFLLLSLLAVSVTLGLLLDATNDETGVRAVRVVVGILGILTCFMLAAFMACLSRAMLLLLHTRQRTEPEEPAVSPTMVSSVETHTVEKRQDSPGH